jgi:hypothetical protein
MKRKIITWAVVLAAATVITFGIIRPLLGG